MEVKKTIKKIAAIGAAAVLFTGLGLAGASAALENLPSPFIEDGVFDAHIIIGTGEWNPDIDMAGFQNDMSIGQEIAGAVADASELPVSETEKVGTELIEDLFYGDNFGYNSYFFTDYYFPQLLTEGRVRVGGTNIDYEQSIEFAGEEGEGPFTLSFIRNLEVDEETLDTYFFQDDGLIYTYLLDFHEGFAIGDLEQERIEIQGQEYFVSEASDESIVLFSGAEEAIQLAKTTQTYVVEGTSYNVEVDRITGEGTELNPYKAHFNINGETLTLEIGDTDELTDETVVGITDIWIDAIDPEGGVEFYIGAEKIELDANGDVEFNDERHDDYDIRSNFGFDGTDLTNITINVESLEELYLAEGESWVDPVFGNWELEFDELIKTVEEIHFNANRGELSFRNQQGINLVIPFVEEVEEIFFGNDVIEGDDTYGNFMMPGWSINETEGTRGRDFRRVQFLAFNTRDEARIFEIDTINCEEETLEYTLRGQTKTFNLNTEERIGTYTINLTCEGDNEAGWNLTFENPSGEFNGGFIIETELGALISFESQIGPQQVGEGFENTGVENIQISFGTVEQEGTLGVMVLSLDEDDEFSTSVDGITGKRMRPEEYDSDIEWGLDGQEYGTLFRRDDDREDVTVFHAEEQVFANMRMNHIGAVIDPVEQPSYEVVEGGPAVPQRPVILIGGPAVNELVNELVPTTWAAEDYTENTAIIQYIEGAFAGNDALIIAGYSREDTEVAGKVVAGNFRDGQFADQLTGNLVTLNTAAGFEGVEFN